MQLLTAEDDRAAHYAGLFAGLGVTADSRVDFWCLDLLWRHFKVELRRYASQAIPNLLVVVVNEKLRVLDRAVLALTATGPLSVVALLQAIGATTNASHTVTFLFAIRESRQYLHLYAKPVLSLLSTKLADSDEQVRWTAMAVLMDISPLRPRFNEQMNPSDFEPLYGSLLAVAQNSALHKQDDLTAQYIGLLRQHLAN